MKYNSIDFKIKRTSKDLCGTYGIAFYENHAVWYKHKCHRIDCPECRNDYIGKWKDKMHHVFNDTIYMTNIKPSEFSSFRHKYNKIPYVKIRFTNYYVMFTGVEIPNSIPVTPTDVFDIIDRQNVHVKNFITANRTFYKACHSLHIYNRDNMQKVAKGGFLGRAVRPLDDDNPAGLVHTYRASNINEKASILNKLHEEGVLRLTEEGKKIVEQYGHSYKFHIDYKYNGCVLDSNAIPVFETDNYIGYIIPARK